MNSCKWKDCKGNVLMDGYCARHLKQTCVICFEKVPSTNSARAKRLTCGHAFHFRCIIKWYENSDDCPICRKPQIKDDLIIFKNNVEESLRRKYKKTINSYERELLRLRQNN